MLTGYHNITILSGICFCTEKALPQLFAPLIIRVIELDCRGIIMIFHPVSFDVGSLYEKNIR